MDIVDFHEQYNYYYKDMIYRGAMTVDEIKNTLLTNGVMTEADYKELENIPKLMEKTKEDMYKTYSEMKSIDSFRFRIKALNERYGEIASQSVNINRFGGDFCARELALFNTLRGYIRCFDNNQLIDDKIFSNLSLHYSDIIVAYYDSIPDDATLRYLARTSPWITIWNISKVEHRLLNKLPHEYSVA
jgi:hypothetical protein